MISPINTNWFVDATWTGTITPQLSAAQSAYNTAESNLAGYTPTYINALQALQAGAPTAAAYQTLKNNFDTAQQQYNLLVSNLKTASLNLLSAQAAARTHVDSQGDANLDAYTSQLLSTINKELKLTGVEINTLDSQLSSANTTRNNTRTAFFTALNNFSTAESNLINARTTLQSLQDQLNLAYAQVQIDILLPSSPAQLASDQAALAALQTQVNNQQTTVNTLTTTRNTAKTTLDNALTTYNSAIDAMISVLQTASDVAHTSATNFIQDLQAAKDQALQLSQSHKSSAAANDAALQAAHTAQYPTADPETVNAIIAAQNLAIDQTMTTLSNITDTTASATSEISFPSLPSSGSMSMSDLMRFISAIQLLIGKLSRELQQSDQKIDELRLKIWSYQGGLLADTTAALQKWAFILEMADRTYNTEVAKNNRDSSVILVNKINDILTQTAGINSIINGINQEISDQNSRGINVVNALNNSNFIATDVVNQVSQAGPNIYNTSDVLNQDPTASTPTPRNDVPQVGYPTTIPPLDPFVPPGNAIPITFPLQFKQSDSGENSYNTPDETSQGDIDTLNDIIDQINNQLYPIKERLSGPPINYTFIEPYTARHYVAVRNLAMFLSISNASEIGALIAKLIHQFSESRRDDTLSSQEINLEGIKEFVEQFTKQTSTAASAQAGQSVGGGAGITGSNILASAGKVAAALNALLSSDHFLESFQALVEQGSLVGGLAALTRIPDQIAGYSLLSNVRSDQLEEISQAINQKVQAAKTQVNSAAATGTVQALINTAGNTALLKQVALGVIAKNPLKGLSEEDVKELIASLLYLLQVLLLLVAALIDAAGGGEAGPIDQLVTKIFEKPDDRKVQQLIEDLKALGVAIPQQTVVTPSSPDFAEALINALFPEFAPKEQVKFVEKLRTVFESRDIPLTITEPFVPKVSIQPQESFQPAVSVTGAPLTTSTAPTAPPSKPSLGTVVQNAINASSLEVRSDIRQEVIALAIEAANELRLEILKDETKRPTLRDRINELIQTNKQNVPVEAPGAPPASTPVVSVPVKSLNVSLETILQTILDKLPIVELPKETIEPPQPDAVGITPSLTPKEELIIEKPVVKPSTIEVGDKQSITEKIVPKQPIESAPTTTTAPSQPQSFTPELLSNIVSTLNKEAPQIPGISSDDRNALVIALVTKAITTEQANQLVSQFLREEALIERSTIADLIVPNGTPVTAGVHGETHTFSTRPKNTLEMFRDAFESLSRRSDDNRLSFEVALVTAEKVLKQTNFYDLSIHLLLDPAKSMVKNFSITTRGGAPGDQQGPLSIPISG